MAFIQNRIGYAEILEAGRVVQGDNGRTIVVPYAMPAREAIRLLGAIALFEPPMVTTIPRPPSITRPSF